MGVPVNSRDGLVIQQWLDRGDAIDRTLGPAPAVSVITEADLAEQEKDFQARLVKLAKSLGWLAYHTYTSKGSAAGFPDLVMVHKEQRRLLFAELKAGRGKLSPQQAEWLAHLEAVRGVEACLWRPEMWREIEQTLRGHP